MIKIPKEKREIFLDKIYCDSVNRGIVLPSSMLGELDYQKVSQTYYEKGLVASVKRDVLYMYRIGGYKSVDTIKDDILLLREKLKKHKFSRVILPTDIPIQEIGNSLNKHCTDDEYLRAFYINTELDNYNNKYLKKRGIDKLNGMCNYRLVEHGEFDKIKIQFENWKITKEVRGDKIAKFGERAFKIFTNTEKYKLYGFFFKDYLLGYQSLRIYDGHAFIYLETIIDEHTPNFIDIVNAMYDEYKNISNTGYNAFVGLIKSRLKKLMIYKMVNSHPNIKVFNIDSAGGNYKNLVTYKKNSYKHSTRLVEVKL